MVAMSIGGEYQPLLFLEMFMVSSELQAACGLELTVGVGVRVCACQKDSEQIQAFSFSAFLHSFNMSN